MKALKMLAWWLPVWIAAGVIGWNLDGWLNPNSKIIYEYKNTEPRRPRVEFDYGGTDYSEQDRDRIIQVKEATYRLTSAKVLWSSDYRIRPNRYTCPKEILYYYSLFTFYSDEPSGLVTLVAKAKSRRGSNRNWFRVQCLVTVMPICEWLRTVGREDWKQYCPTTPNRRKLGDDT